MNFRHGLLCMDVAGLKPLSGMRFCLMAHATATKKGSFHRAAQSTLQVDVFGSCAANTAQDSLRFGCLQWACPSLAALAAIWATNGIVLLDLARSGASVKSKTLSGIREI